MKFQHGIIDMDPLVYRCGFSIEKFNKELDILEVEPKHHAFYNINHMMQKIKDVTGYQTYSAYLTSNDKSNFRFELFPEYKSNRKDARKPVYYKEIRDFCINKWKAEVVSGEEADDACSIKHCSLNELGFDKSILNSVICSFDKDFNNIPGWHYNYVKDEVYYVDEIQALRNFYLQILTGDTSDGIPRIKKGWKQKVCEEAIKEAQTEKEMIDIIFKQYHKVMHNKEPCFTTEEEQKESIEYITKFGRLVWLRRKPEEMWTIPNLWI